MFTTAVRLYRNAYTGIPRPVWWLSLVMLVNRSGTMVIPFLTVYLTQSGYTLTQAGMVMAAFGLGSILGGLLGGKLSDLVGSFRVQIVSLALNGVFFILLAYIHDFWQFVGFIFILSSVGEAFRPANSAAIASYSSDQSRTRAFSLNRLAVNLGWAMGPAVGGFLASIDYALLFWADGCTCILASILLYVVLHKHEKRIATVVKDEQKEPARSVYKDIVFIKAMLLMVLVGVVFFQLFSMIPVFYKQEVGLSEVSIGWLLAINGLIIALVEMVLVYKLEQRGAIILYMVCGAALMGVSFLLLSFAPIASLVIAGMLVVTLGEMLLFPFTNTFWVSRTKPSNRGQYAAAYAITFSLSHVLSPLMAAPIALNWGFPVLFVIDFVFCSIAAFGFLWMRKSMF